MLKRDPILISLSPSSLRIAVLARGEVARVERVVLEGFNPDEAWAAGLRPLDDILRKALGSLGIGPGTPAKITYTSPRLMSEVFVAPATGAAAVEAARMHLRQSLPDGAAGWSTSVLPMLEVQDGASARRQVMLLTADLEEYLNVLAEWGGRCGLNVTSVAPAKGILLEHAVLGAKASDAPSVRIYLDEHTMTLCGWSGGQLAFARCADVGYAILIDAMYRAARGHSGEDVTREYATRLLFAVGMPSRGQVLDPAKKLPAEAVLPLMQPALQRCVIEVRQTLRFGLTEQDMIRAVVSLAGPGTAIPGIGEAMSGHLELPIEVVERKKGGPASGAAEDEVGDLAIAAARLGSALWVVPPRQLERARTRSLTVAVRAGALVGLLTLGALWGGTHRARALVEQELGVLGPQAELIEHTRAQRAQMSRDVGRLAQASAVADAALGRRTSWLSALALATQPADSPVQILGVEGASPRDAGAAPIFTIHARVDSPPAQPDVPEGQHPADPVSAFVQVLTASPVVQSARVVSASAGEAGTGSQVVVEVQLKHVPASLPLLGAVGDATGGTP